MTIEQANAYFASLPEVLPRPGSCRKPSLPRQAGWIIWA